jgi:hypothetical protein
MAKRLYLGKRLPDRYDQIYYEVGSTKEAWDDALGFDHDSFLSDFCAYEFEQVTGIELKEGEIKRLIVEVK